MVYDFMQIENICWFGGKDPENVASNVGFFQGSLMLANVWIFHYQTDDVAGDLTVAPINYGKNPNLSSFLRHIL
jgi:hypothetical protein